MTMQCGRAGAARTALGRAVAGVEMVSLASEQGEDWSTLARRLVHDLALRYRSGSTADEAAMRGVLYDAEGVLGMEASSEQRALEVFERALASLQQAGEERSPLAAQALVGIANQLRHEGRLAEAEDALVRSEQLLKDAGRSVGSMMTDVLNQRTVLASSRGDYELQAGLAQREIELDDRISVPDSPDGLDAWTSLIQALRSLGRYDEALAAWRHAQGIIDRQPASFAAERPYAVSGVHEAGSMVFLAFGDGGKCLELAQRTIDVLQPVARQEGRATLLVPLLYRASCEAQLGQYLQARATLADASRIATADDSLWVERRIRCRVQLARLMLAMGDPDAARDAARAALEGSPPGPPLSYQRGLAHLVLAAAAGRRGDWVDASEESAAAAAELSTQLGPGHPQVLSAQAMQCQAQVRQGLSASGCRALQLALPALESIGAPVHLFDALEALALEAEQRDDIAAARDLRVRALAAAIRVEGASPAWVALDELATHLHRWPRRGREDGNLDRRMAIFLDKEAVLLIDQLREQFQQPATVADTVGGMDRRFLVDKVEVYRRLAGWLAGDGRIDEAVEVLRRSKRQEYSEFVDDEISLRAAGPSSQREDLMVQGERALDEAWLALRQAEFDPAASRRQQVVSRAPAPAQTPRDAAPRPPVASDAPSAADSAPVRRFLEESELPSSQPPSHAHVSTDSTRAGDVDVWVVSDGNRLQEILQSRTRRQVVRLPVDKPTLDGQVENLLRAMLAREPVTLRLRTLYDEVGAPLDVAARASNAHVAVLHLDGALRYLPFAALHDGHGYLGERLAFESRIDAAQAESRDAGRPRVEALGVTRSLQGLLPLPYVEDEICGIVRGPVHGLPGVNAACTATSAALPGEAWLDERFTRLRLDDLLHDAGGVLASGDERILHIATHFKLRPGVMDRSWLLLGDGDHLQLQDIAKLDLRSQSLITLSACDTAVGGQSDGREVDGLGGLLIHRGAGTVIASLWPVEDRSTARLMQQLYAHIASRGIAPAEALRRAQHDVRTATNWSSPLFWAGFIAMTRPAAVPAPAPASRIEP